MAALLLELKDDQDASQISPAPAHGNCRQKFVVPGALGTVYVYMYCNTAVANI